MKELKFVFLDEEESVQFVTDSYLFSYDNLFIQAVSPVDGEPWADITINLPGIMTEEGEAFVSGDVSRELISAMVEANIMELTDIVRHQGMTSYTLAKFNREVLAEYMYSEEDI